MIEATIIADSINKSNCRLTTFVLTFPRWILAELNTHRVLSRNVASSRAIPVEKMIQMVIDNPAMPEFWGKNQKGMQSHEELVGEDLERAKEQWLKARDSAVNSAKDLLATGMHKQYVNRLIENFMYVRVIVSGTDFENFFALRAHPDAQPEFKVLANKILDAYNKSFPKPLNPGKWHVPFGRSFDENRILELSKQTNLSIEDLKIKIAVARCARVSFYNHEGKDDYNADIQLCDKLFGSIPRHLSPTEHVAMALKDSEKFGNFRGFVQYRYKFEDQNLKDPRIIQKTFSGQMFFNYGQ